MIAFMLLPSVSRFSPHLGGGLASPIKVLSRTVKLPYLVINSEKGMMSLEFLKANKYNLN
jgi:hypothetical protein